MIASLPCQPDYQYMQTTLNSAKIKDPALRHETSEFQNWCYGAARAKLFNSHGSISDDLAGKTDWLGSKYFLDTSGYYDSFQARKPIKRFSYVASRDDGHGTGPDQGGYPSCKQWWSASGHGLHDRLYAQIDPSFWQSFKGMFPGTDAEDYAIRALLKSNPHSATGNAGANTGSSGGNGLMNAWGNITGMIGSTIGGLAAEGMSSAASRAMPMVQYLRRRAIL